MSRRRRDIGVLLVKGEGGVNIRLTIKSNSQERTKVDKTAVFLSALKSLCPLGKSVLEESSTAANPFLANGKLPTMRTSRWAYALLRRLNVIP